MEPIELKAPSGKYRVVIIDTLENTKWIATDADSQIEAIHFADKSIKDETMLKIDVYNDQGDCIYTCEP